MLMLCLACSHFQLLTQLFVQLQMSYVNQVMLKELFMQLQIRDILNQLMPKELTVHVVMRVMVSHLEFYCQQLHQAVPCSEVLEIN